jgi:putative transposase
MQFIKGGFSHRAGMELSRSMEIWQRGYVEHRIRDADDYTCRRNYIQRNPVQASLANLPEQYPYSSAHRGLQLEAPPQGLKPW